MFWRSYLFKQLLLSLSSTRWGGHEPRDKGLFKSPGKYIDKAQFIYFNIPHYTHMNFPVKVFAKHKMWLWKTTKSLCVWNLRLFQDLNDQISSSKLFMCLFFLQRLRLITLKVTCFMCLIDHLLIIVRTMVSIIFIA